LILPEYFLFDDALVVPLKIAEILDNNEKTLGELAAEIPTYPTKKEVIDCDDQIKFDVVERLKVELTKEFENINAMDGVRVDLKNGWVLIRSSNTSPIIRLTTEADNEKTLGQLTTQFMDKTEEIIEKIKGETK